MIPKDFEQLCRAMGVKVGDLPAFPPELNEEQWRHLIITTGLSKGKAMFWEFDGVYYRLVLEKEHRYMTKEEWKEIKRPTEESEGWFIKDLAVMQNVERESVDEETEEPYTYFLDSKVSESEAYLEAVDTK